MQFAFLTSPDVEGIYFSWNENGDKTPVLVKAALDAGFSE